jgi:hypothetical protein
MATAKALLAAGALRDLVLAPLVTDDVALS